MFIVPHTVSHATCRPHCYKLKENASPQTRPFNSQKPCHADMAFGWVCVCLSRKMSLRVCVFTKRRPPGNCPSSRLEMDDIGPRKIAPSVPLSPFHFRLSSTMTSALQRSLKLSYHQPPLLASQILFFLAIYFGTQFFPVFTHFLIASEKNMH